MSQLKVVPLDLDRLPEDLVVVAKEVARPLAVLGDEDRALLRQCGDSHLTLDLKRLVQDGRQATGHGEHSVAGVLQVFTETEKNTHALLNGSGKTKALQVRL